MNNNFKSILSTYIQSSLDTHVKAGTTMNVQAGITLDILSGAAMTVTGSTIDLNGPAAGAATTATAATPSFIHAANII